LEVESSTAPLRVASGSGRKLPIDLNLVRGNDAIEPARPVRPTVIGEQLDEGIALTRTGISLTMAGRSTGAALIGGEEAFYSEVANDTDAVATPKLDGADMSALLRSVDSPEELSYRVGVPLGARLVSEGGGAVIRRGPDILGRIPAPWARDAQGTLVPVTMQVRGNELRLDIAHRERAYAYPILVDPELSEEEDLSSEDWALQYAYIGYDRSGGTKFGTEDVDKVPGPPLIEGGPGHEITGRVAFPYLREEGFAGLTEEVVGFETTEHLDDPEFGEGGASLFPHPITHVYFEGLEASWTPGPYSYTEFSLYACTSVHNGTYPTWFAPEAPPIDFVFNASATEQCSGTELFPGNGISNPTLNLQTGTELRWESDQSPPYVFTPGEQEEVGPASFSVAAVVVSWSPTWLEAQELNLPDAETYGGENPAQLTNTDCTAGDPVNCATGDLVENQQDIDVGGLGPHLKVERTYNSQLAATEERPSSFGWGWTSAYEGNIEVEGRCIANCEGVSSSSVAVTDREEEDIGSGLVAAYSFDETEDSTLDDSAGGHDGSIEGAEWTRGKFGSALAFNPGQEDRVTVPSTPAFNLGEFTIEAWIKPNQARQLAPVAVHLPRKANGYGLYAGGYDSGILEGALTEAGSETQWVEAFADPLAIGRWSHVAFTYDGLHLRLYLDGSLVESSEEVGILSGSAPLDIGGGEGILSQWEYFSGKIDELRIYDRALSEGEIDTDEVTPIDPTNEEEPEESEEGGGLEEAEVREEVAIIHQDNGSTAEFRRVGGAAWAPVNPLIRSGLVSEGEGFAYTLPDQTVLHFDASDQVSSEEDLNGNRVTVSRNAEGQISSVSDDSGRELVYSYDPEGFVESVEDPMGQTVRYRYEDGNLVKVSQVDSTEPRWQFIYSRNHELTSVTNARGGVSRTKYEALRAVEQEDPMGRVTHWDYSPGEEVSTTTITEPNGSETVEQFNQDGLISSLTRAAGTALATTTTYGYNQLEELTSATNPEERTTDFAYDGEGNKIGETDPAGHETTWTYNDAHEVTSETLPSGEVTTISRNAAGDPEVISRPAPGEETQTTAFEYGAHGELESMSDPEGATWTYGYNGHGDRTSETDPEGDERTWAYDGDSRVISVVSPRGNRPAANPGEFTTSIERDAQGRPVKVIDPLGGVTEYAYDADGNLESITGPNGHQSTFTYDADDEQIKVERPDGVVEETEYDDAGRVTSQTDGDENETTYVRNALEEPVETVDPLERTTTRIFDAAGHLESQDDPEGRTTTYDYDEDGRLTKVAYSAEAGQDVTYGYDEDGDLTRMADATGESIYEYDQLGRLIRSDNGNGEAVSWQYDLDDEPISLTYPNGKSIARSYDEAARLESVTDWLGHRTSFSYNPDSEPTATTFATPTGDTDEYAYDPADRTSGVTMKKGAETLASLAYARDPGGQVESLVSEGLPGAGDEEFGYDGDERLTEAGEANYGYDASNDLTDAPGTTSAYDQAHQLESTTGASFAYDEEGERAGETPSGGPATTYEYDQEGELTGVERAEEGETPAIAESFAYEGNGLLASRVTGSDIRHLVWDQTESPASLLSDGEDSYIYGPRGLPVEQISSEEVPEYLHHDQLGSTRMLTDGSGADIGKFTYGAYGTLTGKSGLATTALGFAGQYTMGESGLQYLRARFYDPSTAQFITRDPIENITRSPYGYGQEDPISRIDPSGLCGVSSVSDFLESLNPVSEENCAYQAANSTAEAVSDISLPSTREAAEAEVGFFDGATVGLTKYTREFVGIDNGGLALCGSVYDDAGIAGAAVGGLVAVYTPEGLLEVATRIPDASMWVARHGDEITQMKDILEEVLRHVVGK
jgi:RHS repeat-associated protein